MGAIPVQRVRKAHEQVTDQLRALIVSGQLRVGQRLPSETVLAQEFGVSRATVREALRTLAAQRLVVTSKGTGGGTRVSAPAWDYISEFLQANMNLLTEMHDITLEDLIEVREHLEVYAARLAAERCDAQELERLRESVPASHATISRGERFGLNMSFHTVLLEVAGNNLLYVSALPVFNVLQTNLARGDLPDSWFKTISTQHDHVMQAIAAGDADLAGRQMKAHLEFLRPHYKQIWRHAVRPTS